MPIFVHVFGVALIGHRWCTLLFHSLNRTKWPLKPLFFCRNLRFVAKQQNQFVWGVKTKTNWAHRCFLWRNKSFCSKSKLVMFKKPLRVWCSADPVSKPFFSENYPPNPEYFVFRSDKISVVPATLSILLALWWGFQVELADGFRSPTLRAEIGLLLDIIGRRCERQRGRTLVTSCKGWAAAPESNELNRNSERQLLAHKKLNFPLPNVNPVLHPQRIPVCPNESFLRFTQAVELPVRRTGHQTGR